MDRIRTSKALLPSQRYSLLRTSDQDPELELSDDDDDDDELDTALIGRGREDTGRGREDMGGYGSREDGGAGFPEAGEPRQNGGVVVGR